MSARHRNRQAQVQVEVHKQRCEPQPGTTTTTSEMPTATAAARRGELVQVDTARKVLSRVNLLDESNALAIDIGGNLAKLLYLAPRGASTLLIDRVRDSASTQGANELACPVPTLAGTLHFFAFETRDIEELVDFVKVHWNPVQRKTIRATGGGSYKYSELFRENIGVNLVRIDELMCAVAGLNFMLHYVDNEVYVYDPPPTPAPSAAASPPQVRPDVDSDYDCRRFIGRCADPFPYLFVNVGSGVSIVKVIGHGKFERISGSALGGGTFWGLARLLLNCKTFDDVIALTNRGNHRGVDMLVGDIYGGAYTGLNLDADVIAASFGKVTMTPAAYAPQSSCHNAKKAFIRAVRATAALWLAVLLALPIIGPILRALGVVEPFGSKISNLALSPRFRAEDVAISLLRMVAYNIGQIAYLNARVHGLDRIYFGGNFVRNHPHTIADVSFAVDFWSDGKTKAHFLKHDGYLGAIGAFIGGESEEPEKHVVAPKPREKRTKSDVSKPSNSSASAPAPASVSAASDASTSAAPAESANKTQADPAPGSTTTTATATVAAPNGTAKSGKARRKARARATAAAIANGHGEGGTNADTTATTANGYHVADGVNGHNKENCVSANANGVANGVANGNGIGIYYDDDLGNEAVQDLLAGEWQTVKRGRGKPKPKQAE